MNALGIALLWCVVQVTLLGLLSGALYLVVRRPWPAAAAPVTLTGLLTVVLLSALALAPWPRWPLLGPAARAAGGALRATKTSIHGNEEIAGDSAERNGDGARWNRAPLPTQDAASDGPSRAVLWWQTFLEEVSHPQPVASEPGWRWPAVVAVLLLTGMAAGAAWLLLGFLAVQWQRAKSRPVEAPALLELVDTLRADLGCRRPIELRQGDDLATAATIGWRRPVILLPCQWTAWTADQRRAVLAHEIAHVRRNDFLAILCGQLGLVLHFYHPLLHWMMARLRLEQELAADASAASVTGGQRHYLTTLAELALRQDSRPLVWPARSFLPTQTTFLRRIAMLRNSKLHFDRLSPSVRTLAVGTVLLCGLLAAGFRAPTGLAPALAENAGPAAVSNAPEGPDEIDTTFFTEDAEMILVERPAAVFGRPELAWLGRLLQQSTYVVPEGTRLSDFRQITLIAPPRPEEPPVSGQKPRIPGPVKLRDGPTARFNPWEPSGLQEIVAFQSIKPLAAASLVPRDKPGVAVKEYQGKKVYAGLLGSLIVLQYDDRTLITFGGESRMYRYFAARPGALPRWLPSKAWEAFRGDHFVLAADAAPLRKDMAGLAKVGANSPVTRAALFAFSSLWLDTAWAAVGAKLDGNLAVQVRLEGRDAEAATRLLRTAEASKVLLQNMLKQARKQLESVRSPTVTWAIPLVNTGDRLLAGTKIQQDGKSVRALGTAEINAAALRSMGVALANARRAADRARSMNNLKQIALAMHNYHAKYGHLPPAVLYGPDGKTPYSWRVALLPFLEQEALYKQYHFDEPWDGPHNRRLAETRVPEYSCRGDAPGSANASYFALVGPGTVFEKKDRTKPSGFPGTAGATPNAGGTVAAAPAVPWSETDGISFMEITDGAPNTILVVEAKRDIPWSKPEDIPYDPKKPLPEFGGCFEGGFHVALCDGSVHFLRKSIAEATLRAMITRNGGEVIDWSKEVDKR